MKAKIIRFPVERTTKELPPSYPPEDWPCNVEGCDRPAYIFISDPDWGDQVACRLMKHRKLMTPLKPKRAK